MSRMFIMLKIPSYLEICFPGTVNKWKWFTVDILKGNIFTPRGIIRNLLKINEHLFTLALSSDALIFLPTGFNLYHIIKILTADAFRAKHFYRMSKFPPNVNKILVANSMSFSYSRCPPFSLWKSPIQSLIQTQVSSHTNHTRNEVICLQMLVARLVLARNNKNLYFIVFLKMFLNKNPNCKSLK